MNEGAGFPTIWHRKKQGKRVLLGNVALVPVCIAVLNSLGFWKLCVYIVFWA